MFRIFLMALWISNPSWMSMGNRLDASLQAKKSNDEVAEVKEAVTEAAENIEAEIDEVKSDLTETIKQDAARVKAAAQAAVPAIRVSDTCTLKVCGKDNGYHISHYEYPHWYDLYRRAFIRTHLKDYENSAKYEEVPTWKDVEYCITIRQQNDKTHITSWWENLPASRFYQVLVGYVQYDEDEEEDLEIAENKDACDGEVMMRWKYLIDMFQTGDDFEKLPTERTNVDDMPYSSEDSIVHYRTGKRKFTGKLLEHMSRWRARKAYWVVDGTLLEAAADVPSGRLDDDGNFFSPDAFVQKYLEKVSGAGASFDKGLNTFFFISSIGPSKFTTFNTSSPAMFWDKLMKEEHYTEFKNQKKLLFDSDVSNGKKSVEFITNFVRNTDASTPSFPANPFKPPVVDKSGVDVLALRIYNRTRVEDAGACPADGCRLKNQWLNSECDVRCQTEQNPVIFKVSLGNLFDKVRYDDYNKMLAIVECGLFPKTLPKPKNCKVKSESEATFVN